MAEFTTIYNAARTHLNWNGAILTEKAARSGKAWIVHRHDYTVGPYYEGEDFSFAPEDALILADASRRRRIRELEQEIQRLRELNFTIIDGSNYSRVPAIARLALERAQEVG